MLKNYFITSLRFLKNNKTFTLINILGLSLAFSACFIIVMYVINEYSYDKSFNDATKIFKVAVYYKNYNSKEDNVPYALTPVLKAENPDIEYVANTRQTSGFQVIKNSTALDINAVGTQKEIFNIFSIPLIQGAFSSNLLEDKYDIIISQSVAKKLFGEDDAVSKQIDVIIHKQNQTLTVRGVYPDFAENSTFQAECFINDQWELDYINLNYQSSDANTNWHYPHWQTWVKLKTAKVADNLFEQLKNYAQKNNYNPASEDKYYLINLLNLHLYADEIQGINNHGNLKTIKLFILIAILLIITAIINYIIMSTALMIKRMKEVGIRKCSGATIGNLRTQLSIEAMLIILASLILASGFIQASIAGVARLFNTPLHIISGNRTLFIVSCLIIGLLTGFITSSYGAFCLSRQKVKDLVQSKLIHTKKFSVKTVLIAIQIVVFLFFVSGSLFINHQYKFMLKKDLGYNTKNILYVKVPWGWKDYNVFLEKIRNNANIISAGGSSGAFPVQRYGNTIYENFKDKNIKVEVSGTAVDFGFLETMGVQLVKGRFFSEVHHDLYKSTIINETAARELGLENPIGQKLGDCEIVGVIKDFIPFSLHNAIPPLSIDLYTDYIDYIAVKYRENTFDTVNLEINKYWNALNTDIPLETVTFEELNKEQYQSELQLNKITSLSALFTAIIASLGLFGLALFEMQQKNKEIGVRKVLGATIPNLMLKFYRQNLIAFFVSFFISIPISYYALKQWMENFAYKSPVNWWIFLISGAIAFTIIILTATWQSWKVANTNLVEVIQNE